MGLSTKVPIYLMGNMLMCNWKDSLERALVIHTASSTLVRAWKGTENTSVNYQRKTIKERPSFGGQK